MYMVENKIEINEDEIGKELKRYEGNNYVMLKVVKSYKDDYAVENAITYVESHPISNGAHGLGCSDEPDKAVAAFKYSKAAYLSCHADTGDVQARHFVVGFAKNDWIDERIIQIIAYNIAVFFVIRGYQNYYAIHPNSDGSFHVHIIVNAFPVPCSGQGKLSISKEFKGELNRYIRSLRFDENHFFVLDANGFY